MRGEGPSADSVADAVAELGTVLAGADPEQTRSAVRALVADPLRWAAREPHWPSLLGDGGLPLELSVKDAGTTRGVRCTVDPCDHRRPLSADLPGLVAAARRTVGPAPQDQGARGWAVEPGGFLHHLLAGAPDSLPAPAMLSVGVGGGGLGRTSVYARTSYWATGELAARLPAVAAILSEDAAIHGRIVRGEPEVVGVDYVDGRPVRWKTYHWMSAAPRRHAGVLGTRPDLLPGAALVERYVGAVPRAATERAGFVQVTGGTGEARHKLFLFASAWGWSTRAGLVDLLSFLPTLGLPIDVLAPIRAVLARHGVPARLSMVAIGGAPRPTVSYYFAVRRRT